MKQVFKVLMYFPLLASKAFWDALEEIELPEKDLGQRFEDFIDPALRG